MSLTLMLSTLAVVDGANALGTRTRDFSGYSLDQLLLERERVETALDRLYERRADRTERIARLSQRQTRLRSEITRLESQLPGGQDTPAPQYPQYPADYTPADYPPVDAPPVDCPAGEPPAPDCPADEPVAEAPPAQEETGAQTTPPLLSARNPFAGLFTVTARASALPEEDDSSEQAPEENPEQTPETPADNDEEPAEQASNDDAGQARSNIAALRTELAGVNTRLATYRQNLVQLDAQIAGYKAEHDAIVAAIAAIGALSGGGSGTPPASPTGGIGIMPASGTFNVLFSVSPSIGGTVNGLSAYTRVVDDGSAVGAAPAAAPSPGWEFVNWTHNGSAITPADISTMIVDTGGLEFVANFQQLPNIEFRISPNPGGSFETPLPTNDIPNATQPLYVSRTRLPGAIVGAPPTPVANAGWQFTGWTHEGNDILLWAIVPMNVTAAHTSVSPLVFVANFAPIPEIAKAASPTAAIKVGDTFTYSLTVTNPNSAVAIPAGTVVEDSLNFSLVQWVNNSLELYINGVRQPGFSDYYVTLGGLLRVTLPLIPASGNARIEFDVTALEAAATTPIPGTSPAINGVRNMAYIVTPPSQANIPSNNVDVEVEPLPEQTTTVTIEATAPTTAVPRGSNFNYTIAIENTGTYAATDVVVQSNLPTNVSFVSSSSTMSGVNFTHAARVLTANIASLAPGQTVTFTVAVTADTIGTGVVNAASVSGENFTTASDTATVSIIEPAVTITKTATPTGPVTAGSTVAYSLVVTNTGTATLNNVTVTDTLPAQLTNPTAPTLPTGATGSFTGQTLTVNLAPLTPGSSVTITFNATVAAGTAVGTEITNTARAAASAIVYDTDSATITTQAGVPNAAVSITNTAGVTTVSPGGDIPFTLVVTNTGSVALTDLVITETLPTQLNNPRSLVLPTGVTGSFSNRVLTANIASLPPGASRTITFTATVASATASGTTINSTANVTATAYGTTASVTAYGNAVVNVQAAPTISKSANDDEVRPGGRITYTITVRNRIATPLENITVEDPIDIDLVNFIRGSVRVNGARVDYIFDDGELFVPVGTIPANGTRTVTFQVEVRNRARVDTEIVNTANLEGPGINPQNPPRSTATVTVTTTTGSGGTTGDGAGGGTTGGGTTGGGDTGGGDPPWPGNMNPWTGGFADSVTRAVFGDDVDSERAFNFWVVVWIASLLAMSTWIIVGVRKRSKCPHSNGWVIWG